MSSKELEKSIFKDLVEASHKFIEVVRSQAESQLIRETITGNTLVAMITTCLVEMMYLTLPFEKIDEFTEYFDQCMSNGIKEIIKKRKTTN